MMTEPGYGQDEGLAGRAAAVIALLASGGRTLASCESITGGGIGWTLTSVPGSSAVYRGGLITYASELKASLAGVDAEFIAAHGVINERTAREMALGALRVCGSDLAVAVTGTAGPEGEDGVAPGCVWLCVADANRQRSENLQLSGDRQSIRRTTIAAALDLVLLLAGTA